MTEIRKKDGQYKKYCSLSCQHLGVAEKAKQTSILKYGVSNPSKSTQVIQKIKDSFTEKYGEGITNAMDLKEFRQKIKDTNIERYGTDKPQLLPEIETKSKETCLKKYGIEKPQKLKELKDKSTMTCNKLYVVNSPQQNKEIRQKSIDTCLEKYGVENSSQDIAIYDKTMRRLYRTKDYTFPSGKLVRVQGYEPFAIDYLLQFYNESAINIETFIKPRITYLIELKKHYYFPDIYIPKDNLIVEVKSIYTYNKNKPKNMLKRQACIDSGYKFRFMIFDKNGNLLDIEDK